jgi:hypothetical protein
MENINDLNEPTTDSIIEDVVVETPVEETAPVQEEPTPVVEPVVEAPVVQEQEVIGKPQYFSNSDTVAGVGLTETGAIGVTQEKREPKKSAPKAKKENTEEKVALFSTRNVTWPEVGKVYRGYNIVSKSVADQWLTRDHVRTATAEEVAKAFGK